MFTVTVFKGVGSKHVRPWCDGYHNPRASLCNPCLCLYLHGKCLEGERGGETIVTPSPYHRNLP